MIDELLPIGSIILVKDLEKKMMITGVKQMNADTEEMYDYAAVLYPEGSIGPDYQFVFNHADVTEVIFRGFENEERNYFMNELKKIFEPENALDIPAEPLQEELDAEKLGAGDLNLE